MISVGRISFAILPAIDAVATQDYKVGEKAIGIMVLAQSRTACIEYSKSLSYYLIILRRASLTCEL